MISGDRLSWIAQGLIIAAPLVLTLAVDDAFLHDSITQVLIFAVLAMSWNLLGGYARQISIGHVAFFGIGAYTSTILYIDMGLSPWIGMIAGGFLAAAMGVFIGLVTFRLRGKFFTMATIAFAEVVRILAIDMRGLTRGSEGISIASAPDPTMFVFDSLRSYALVTWLLMVGIFVLTVLLERSRTGLRLRAFREEEDAARALGIHTVRLRLLVIALSAFCTAIGGTFYAQYLLFIDPESVFGVGMSLQMALMAVVGGIGTAIGPIIGTLIVAPFGQILRAEFGSGMAGAHLVVYGVGLILVLYKMPEGIWPSIDRVVRRLVGRGRPEARSAEDAP